jgi:hypothetical protein
MVFYWHWEKSLPFLTATRGTMESTRQVVSCSSANVRARRLSTRARARRLMVRGSRANGASPEGVLGPVWSESTPFPGPIVLSLAACPERSGRWVKIVPDARFHLGNTQGKSERHLRSPETSSRRPMPGMCAAQSSACSSSAASASAWRLLSVWVASDHEDIQVGCSTSTGSW